MLKYFVSYDEIISNSLELADKIYKSGFNPDIMYSCLRGGAYLGNIISEYFKVADKKRILYAAVVTKSYVDINKQEAIKIEGWTYEPSFLENTDKVLLVDDIYDSGLTVNHLVKILLSYGLKEENIKVAVYDYKDYKLRNKKNIVPNYYCKRHEIHDENKNPWVHYLTHEILGLSYQEIEEYYKNPKVKSILKELKAKNEKK